MRGDGEGLFQWGVMLMSGSGGGGAAGDATTAATATTTTSIQLPTPMEAALGLGLIHLAAAAGVAEAWALLAHSYAHGTAGPAAFPTYQGATLPGAGVGVGAVTTLTSDTPPSAPPLLPHHVAVKTARAFHTLRVSGGLPAADISTLNALFSPLEPTLPQAPVPLDVEMAAFYASWAADAAEASIFTRGGRPHTSSYPRLTSDSADTGLVEVNERGMDDGALARLVLLGEAGAAAVAAGLGGRALAAAVEAAHPGWGAAAAQCGELMYWGARGFVRDQARALLFFLAAALYATPPELDARLSAARMLAMGEGAKARNMTRALELWHATAEDALQAQPPRMHLAVRAWNGLGFAYFSGQAAEGEEGEHTALAENKTLAFECALLLFRARGFPTTASLTHCTLFSPPLCARPT